MADEFEQLRQLLAQKPVNYYTFWGLEADYSRPGLVSPEKQTELIEKALYYGSLKEDEVPAVDANYTWAQIEQENKDWWPTHCEALRQGRGDILTVEYHKNLVYFCQDGPFVGTVAQQDREQHWWALIAQTGVTMCWPIVFFWREFVHFEWNCVDNETNETTSKGMVAWVRRGHRGGCYFKSEQLTFYRDVYAPPALLP
ncbi:hypothetical protein NIES4074_42600 [Cylindrospermum sp. NIES-4074]|nr:hypothetical protein NIES4074_42600 [Cylindrospermum sp. NIES-4074]